ncbi:PAAR-like protein [Chryseobacterium sp. 2TAF14]|uniref:PAAR-like protein n=1 Tax=Chryseobacterium sp. 2TAF14 TaxID=3233007 RepID=UPI003F91AF1A
MAAEPIPYTVKSGDTYSSIAKKLGLKDWHKLKDYHNEHAGFNHQVGNTLYANTTLLTPPPDEVAILNGDTSSKDESKNEQQKEEQKQKEEKEKQEEEKKQEQASKSEHDGKYFVVHGAKCVCDKAEDPTKTADLQVTTHNIIVLNDQSGKYLATEDDKTFMPPAATFGKCTLKPSSSGNLPCALAAAPKWNKSYESTQVQGKKSLTEISELLCTTGGKITIDKHGQTDSVSNAHADNTNPLELAMVNPAVEQPKKKTEYPSVTFIYVTKVENQPEFKAKSSKDKSIIYLRKGEEAKFEAQLSNGNKQLTSWVVYTDHKGSKENRFLIREQIGTEFSQSFEQLGKYRVEGYGKPKSPDFEKGKYDKCDADCSIDIEVVENTLLNIECTTNEFSTRVDAKAQRKFRHNFPSVFKAKFNIPQLTEDEKSRVKMFALDEAGNVLTDAVQTGIQLTLIPKNKGAKYTIIAEYSTETGEKISKEMSGITEGNVVLSITNPAQVIRPGTAMTFSVSKMRYKFLADDENFGLPSDEASEIKWNLNGEPLGTGKSITIPGFKLTRPGKYVVEAYSITANAYGKGAKKEDDDWHFEVKENDVVSFSLSATPKVGKPVTATADKMIFPNLLPNETVNWRAPFMTGTGQSVTVTPKVAGKFAVTCKINSRSGVTKNVDVIQAIINNITFVDSQGNKIEKASWEQDINLWMEQTALEGEKIDIVLWDDDLGPTDDPVKTIAIKSYNGGLIPVTLDSSMKGKTGSHGLIYAKVTAPELIAIGEGKDFPKSYKLDVEDKKEIYSAILGSADGKEKHTLVDYDEISYFYAHTRGIKPSENLYLEIRNSVFGKDPLLLYAKNVKVDKSGVIREKIVWNNIRNKINLLTVYAMVKENNTDGKVLYDADGNLGMAAAKLKKGSSLAKLAGYTGAVKVGSDVIQQPVNENGVCECEARVRAFLRMLRVKEDTVGDSGYEKIVGGKSFIKDHGRDWSTHPDISVYIKRINDSSDAAGAYQIMGTTYNEMKAYRKQYRISDFTPESQDKMCLIILKHNYTTDRYDSFYNTGNSKKDEWRKRYKGKQGDIIKFIIENDIQRAELIASLCWASLPNSPYGQQSSDYTYEDVKKIYDKYLQEELKAPSKELHLKKGFLKEFGYSCCDGEPTNTPVKPNKKGYDIDKAVDYIISNAKTKKPYGDCALYVRKAINSGGISGSWGDAWQYINALPKIGFTDLGKITNFKKGDIVVFNKTGGRKWGHISMWTGSQWVSDFTQNSIIVHNDYIDKDYHIFRWQ